VRLSLCFLIAGKKPLADDDTRVAIGVITVATRRIETQNQWCARRIAFFRLACFIASDLVVTDRTLPACPFRIHAARDQASFPCFVTGEPEDSAFHPIRSFLVRPPTIAPFLRREGPKMLEDQHGGSVRDREVYNPSAHQMRDLLIKPVDFSPKGAVILFAFRENSGQPSVPSNSTQKRLPTAVHVISLPDEAGSNRRAVRFKNGADRQVMI